MKIIDDAGTEVPTGETGEIVVKTPIVMLGYLDDPEQTRAAFVDGWFRTGDVAWRDEDGYFYISSRAKRTSFAGAARTSPAPRSIGC